MCSLFGAGVAHVSFISANVLVMWICHVFMVCSKYVSRLVLFRCMHVCVCLNLYVFRCGLLWHGSGLVHVWVTCWCDVGACVFCGVLLNQCVAHVWFRVGPVLVHVLFKVVVGS